MAGTHFQSGLSTVKAVGTNKSGVQTDYIHKTAVIRCTAATTETSTGFTLPTNCIVKDVYINVLTVDATETVAIGTDGSGSNDPDGFMTLGSLATTGIVIGSLADGAVTRGALLFEITEVTTAAARKWDTTSGGETVTYTCSAGSDTAVFEIIVEYIEWTS